MPSSYARIILHTTFSTKYRRKWIRPEDEYEMSLIMRGELNKLNCQLLRFGAVADHVHLVHSLARTVTLAKVMQHVKAVSSGWIKTRGPHYKYFDWQDGYASFSADYRTLDGLYRYVDNQKEHHGQLSTDTFEREYEDLLRAYDLLRDSDRKYLFPDEDMRRG